VLCIDCNVDVIEIIIAMIRDRCLLRYWILYFLCVCTLCKHVITTCVVAVLTTKYLKNFHYFFNMILWHFLLYVLCIDYNVDEIEIIIGIVRDRCFGLLRY